MDTAPTVNADDRFVGHRMMIVDGRSVDACSGETLTITDPATGKAIGTVPRGSALDVDLAVASAREAFERGTWRNLAGAERARVMIKYAELVELHAAELAHLETLESGMLYSMARFAPATVASYLRYYAGWADKIQGATAEISTGFTGLMHAFSLKQPIGVCGLITPWNFPLSLIAIKIAPALAAGCVCVIKPSEETPFSTIRLIELALEAGVPPGVLNGITGYGHEVGAAIAAHNGIDKVAFTGSTRVGKEIVKAASGNLKRVTLELGGKSPIVVFDDADLDAAIAGVSSGIFMRSGQMCIAGSRLYVQRKSFKRMVEGIAGIAASMKIGDPFASDTGIGPLISEQQLSRVTSLVAAGVSAGAELVTGGTATASGGYFMAPTILANAPADSSVMQEEIFGPVLCATIFDEPSELLLAANDSCYGLAAGIWSRDVGTVHRLAKALQAGVVWANCALVTDPSLPVAGHKQSGWGAELGREGLDAYLSNKAVYIGLGT